MSNFANMEPILKTISEAYLKKHGNLSRMCFLFPNKRCGIFLKKYLSEAGVQEREMPVIFTISEFAAKMAGVPEASRIILLFVLFNSYKKVLGKAGEKLEFEKFRGWGDIVLGDFNTIDFYMRDPEIIFQNLKNFREIRVDYFTDEQKEVMSEYFGVRDFSSPERFWKAFEEGDESELKQKFLNLWQVLAPLYDEFVSELEKEGMATPGLIFRKAAMELENDGAKELNYKKIVAVGFNALTESEFRIFKALKGYKNMEGDEPLIDFVWDAAGPVLESKDFSASRFVDFNQRYFPTPQWLAEILEEKAPVSYPDIEIISSPSATAQAKVAGEVLSQYNKRELSGLIDNAEVALVLPDETLLTNTLFSIPDDIGEINLTMSYSLRQASVSSFMTLLRRVYATMKESSKGGHNLLVSDLKLLFSHPFAYFLFDGPEIEETLEFFIAKHKVAVALTELEDHLSGAASVFSVPSKKESGMEMFGFLQNILNKIKDRIKLKSNNTGSRDLAQIDIYSEYLAVLKDSMERYGVTASPLTVMQLVDKLVSAQKIGFEGEPLHGLQVMGTLETRVLDFRHVIMMSMNEGLMPRRSYHSTFIPEALRKGYGLPPARYAEEIFGYYFYRLISRAEKVTLIYDGRNGTGRNGGESRYLLQLRQYVPSDRLHEAAWQYRLQNHAKRDASVVKTPEIRAMLEDFSSTGDLRKNFSASSLNTYRECQVKFFYQNVLNINSDPERGDYIDSITIGHVLHNVMMELYMPEKFRRKLLKDPILIDKDFLKKIIKKPSLVWQLVEKNIRSQYFGNTEGESGRLEPGVTEMVGRQIVEIVLEIVKNDLRLAEDAPIELYGCEISEKLQVTLPSGRVVNFNFAIDRLDCIEEGGEKKLRIIDYKTGERKRTAKSIESMFEGGYRSEQIFQLFTYAWLLGKLGREGWKDVVTEIYYVPDMIKGKRGFPEIGGEKVDSFAPYADEFSQRIEEMVEGIFESDEFQETEDSEQCRLCAFKSVCGK